MNRSIEELKLRLEELEKKITAELKRNSVRFRYTFLRNRPVFPREIRAEYRKQVKSPVWFLLQTPFLYILTAPVIYAVILPALLLDLFVTVYQHINFRVYGIGTVKRSDHIIIDRHRLPYLNIIEKINCIYCGYFNGLISYVREVAARTEQFWCPIRHARPEAPRHSRTNIFVDYGDASFHEKLGLIRKKLQQLTLDSESPEKSVSQGNPKKKRKRAKPDF